MAASWHRFDSERLASSSRTLALPRAADVRHDDQRDPLVESPRAQISPAFRDSKQALRMQRYFIAAGSSLLAIGIFLACAVQGALPRTAFLVATSLVLVAMAAFYAAFRSKLNLKFQDPSLTLPQMGVATIVVSYAMYSANAARGVFLVLLLMVFLFGVFRLRTKTLMLYAIFVLFAYAGVIVLLQIFKPLTLDLDLELLQWVALASTLPWFALMGGYISGLRDQLRKSNVEQGFALQTLRASELNLAQAQRIARLGSWTFDPTSLKWQWSPEMYRLFGVDPTQTAPSGDEFLRLLHPDDRQRHSEVVRPALLGGRSFDSQFRIATPGGEARWVHALGEPVLDAHGLTLMHGTVMDITDRKAQETALKLAHEHATAAQATLVDAIESLTEAFALFDAEDKLILCNRKYAETFTNFHSFGDIAGMTFADLVRSSIAKGEVIDRGFAGNVEAWVAERVRRHRNPGPKPLELQVTGGCWLQIAERRTKAGGLVGVRRDITERKQLEQRLAMEHAVTRLLAESRTIREAMPKIIEIICKTLSWDCGARWGWDNNAQVLHCVETWGGSTDEVRNFLRLSSEQDLAPTSSGLVRRAWASATPVWIAEILSETGFLRGPLATAAGLCSAFAFPIRKGTQPCSVMEFYSKDRRQPDQALLAVVNSIGLQIGQFMARIEAQEQVRQLAHFDGLTGLPNRNLFNQLIANSILKAKRRGTRLSLLFIDLDGFKQVNDRFGHDAGDHLLATFALRLRESLRDSDAISGRAVSKSAARLGGDEFVVLIDDFADHSALAAVAKKILAIAAKPFNLAGSQAYVSASIGISVYPTDGTDAESLTKSADSAMYCAKQAGTNSYRFFSDAVDERARVPTLAS
jgi:diguanylate cyclase (GGDEF)-like protein/PAS domain S-box-containing protein